MMRQVNRTSVGPAIVAVRLILLLLICAVVGRSANIALIVRARPSVNAVTRQLLMTASGNRVVTRRLKVERENGRKKKENFCCISPWYSVADASGDWLLSDR